MRAERLAQCVKGAEVTAQAAHAKVEQDGDGLRPERQVLADGQIEVDEIGTCRRGHGFTLAMQ